MSVSRLCFLPGGLPRRCASAGLFPCFSADCLSGETGVKRIKFVNNDNTSRRLWRKDTMQMSGNARNLYSTHERATARLFCNFFLSIARVHRILLLKTVKLWVAFFRNNFTPNDERKDTKAYVQQRTH